MKKILLKWHPLLIILLLASVLRIIFIINRGTFWFDESFSVHFSTLPSWIETWKYWVLETNPPFYTFFLRFYLFFANQDSELLVRLPSLVFGLANIILLYIFAEKILSRKAAVISSTMLAFSGLHVFSSTEARVYSLLALLTTISFFIFYSLIIEQKDNKKMWFLYAIINILLIYSHLTSLVVVLIQFLILHFNTNDKKILKKWYLTQFISFALWSFWFIPSILSKFNLNSGNAWFFENPGNITSLLLYPLINALGNNLLNTIFTLLLFIAFYVFVNMVKEAPSVMRRNTLIFIATWALLPIVLSAAVGSFTVKYIMVSYPAFFMLVAGIIEKYITNKKSFFAFIMFIIIVFSPSTINLIFKPLFSWKIPNNYLMEKDSGQAIVFIPFMQEISFKKYYNGKIPLVSMYFKNDNFSLEERVVRYNWQLQNTTKEELYDWILKKTEKDDIKQIFLLTQRDKFKIVEDVLLEHHWTKESVSPPVGLDNYIIEFNAPNNNTTSTVGLPTNR